MYYKELARRLRRQYLDSLGNVVLQKPADVYYDCNQASTAITNLLARAEAAEARAEKYKAFVDDVAGKPGCNTCANQECPYRPNPGELTRFNCPLWCGPEEKRRNEYEKTDNG